MSNLNSNFKVLVTYLKFDIYKKQRSFKIGFITIFLVVLFTSILLNTIPLSTYIFLKISENSVAELDIVVLSNPQETNVQPSDSKIDSYFNKSIHLNVDGGNKSEEKLNKLLDFNHFSESLKSIPWIQGIVPRWVFFGNVSYGNYWTYSTLMIIDSERENKIKLGRQLIIGDLKKQECYLGKSLYKSLKVNSDFKSNNESVNLHINLGQIFESIGAGKIIKLQQEKLKDFLKNLNESKSNEFQSLIFEQIMNADNLTDFLFSISKYSPKFYSIPLNYPVNENSSFFEEIAKTFVSSLKTDSENSIFHYIFYEKSNNSLNIDFEKLFYNKNKGIEVKSPNFKEFITKTSNINISSLNMSSELKIQDVIPNDSGKFPSALGNVLIIDSKYLKELIVSSFLDSLKDVYKSTFFESLNFKMVENSILTRISDFDINKYALSIGVLINDKFDIYTKTFTQRRIALSRLTNEITSKIGLDHGITYQFPIHTDMANYVIVDIFLDNILYSVMFFLIILCVMLTYSLLLGNVDERTYEFGILRAVGYHKGNLIFIILCQSLIFSIIAIILALITAFLINVVISKIFFNYSGIGNSYALFNNTIIWGISSGIIISMISSYFPIKKALSSNLKDSLTIFSKTFSDISISILKLEKLGISPSAMLVSLIFILMGFTTYYIEPMLFLFQYFTTYIFVLNVILILTIIGMILILQIFVPRIERLILRLMIYIWRSDKNIEFIVEKNLKGHSKRNQKTSIMFTIALAFVIFAGCGIEQITSFIENSAKNIIGSDLTLYMFVDNDSLDQVRISNYLEGFVERFPDVIKNYSFVTFPLTKVINKKYSISNLCEYPKKQLQIVGVEQSLMNSIFQDIYRYGEINNQLKFKKLENNQIDVISSLFINNSTYSKFKNMNKSKLSYPPKNITEDKTLNGKDLLIIISEGLRNDFALTTDSPAYLSSGHGEGYTAKIASMQIKLAGFPFFSSYSTLSKLAPGIISIDQYNQILMKKISKNKFLENELRNSAYHDKIPDLAPKQILFIKFQDDTSKQFKDTVFIELMNLIDTKTTYISSTDDLLNSAKDAKDILNYFFLIIGIISLILSFLLIWISFNSNIRDNICEFGIMRSIGLSKKQTLRVYLYEATALILTSIFIGTMVGVSLSAILIIQFNFFVEFPFKLLVCFKAKYSSQLKHIVF